MSNLSDYIREHRLVLRYGAGLLLLGGTVVVLLLSGEPARLVGLKSVVTVPVVIALLVLPQIYGEKSARPFTPGFVERGLLVGVVLGCWIAVLIWDAGMDPWASPGLALVAAGVYFALHLFGGWLALRRSR